MDVWLVLGVIALGIVHGVLPDHGWPIAATYALEFRRKWFRGTVAALILGIGHLVSSVALVLAYFWFSRFAEFAEGPYMAPLAGVLLIGLGIYTYMSGGHGDHGIGGHEHGHEEHEHGHDHGHEREGHGRDHDEHGHDGHDHGDHQGHDGDRAANGGVESDRPGHEGGGHHEHEDHGHHGHDHDEHGHHDHDASDDGIVARVRGLLPGGGGHQHLSEEHANQGLMTLGATALLLGFAHEEPLQILAICAGTEFCLELMLIYSLAVIVAILAPTLLLIAGYQHHRERIEQYTPYLPTLTAAVLILVGLGFVVGVF